MKKLLKVGSIVAVAAAFIVSVAGGQVQAASNGEVSPNIVGGNNAAQQYGAISLWYPDAQGVNRHRCTATHISRYWAITAAHCGPILVPGQTQVRASSLNNNDGNYEEVGLAAPPYIHPNFAPATETTPSRNDIALIRFQRPIQKSQPVTMLTTSSAVGTLGKMAGWGWICDSIPNPPNCGLPYSNVLQELSVKIVKDTQCVYLSDQQSRQEQLCGVAANGQNAMGCYGDSGSPFVRRGFNEWLLMGVTLGDGDANTDHANPCSNNPNGGQGTGRFIDTSRYVPWIVDTIIHASDSSQLPAVVKN